MQYQQQSAILKNSALESAIIIMQKVCSFHATASMAKNGE